MKSIVILHNQGSGFGDKRQAIEEAFGAHKASIDFVDLCEGFEAKIVRFYESGNRTFVAAGGDGTVNALVSQLIDKPDVRIGIIPVGTLNHLAKDLKIPLNTIEAVELILSGKDKKIDIGQVDNQIFLNNSSVGIYARIANTKKRTSNSPLRFMLGILSGLWFVINPPIYKLDILVDRQTLKRTTPIIFVGNNKFDLTGYGLFNRDHLDKGELSVFIIRTHNPLRLLLVCGSILVGRINSIYFEKFSAEELEIHTRRKKLLVAYDGEVNTLSTPLKYTILSKKIKVIA